MHQQFTRYPRGARHLDREDMNRRATALDFLVSQLPAGSMVGADGQVATRRIDNKELEHAWFRLTDADSSGVYSGIRLKDDGVTEYAPEYTTDNLVEVNGEEGLATDADGSSGADAGLVVFARRVVDRSAIGDSSGEPWRFGRDADSRFTTRAGLTTSWTVPAGVTRALFIAQGAGGGAGGNGGGADGGWEPIEGSGVWLAGGSGGGGGGGGGAVVAMCRVVPGESVTITSGTAGTKGADGTAGENGGTNGSNGTNGGATIIQHTTTSSKLSIQGGGGFGGVGGGGFAAASQPTGQGGAAGVGGWPLPGSAPWGTWVEWAIVLSGSPGGSGSRGITSPKGVHESGFAVHGIPGTGGAGAITGGNGGTNSNGTAGGAEVWY